MHNPRACVTASGDCMVVQYRYSIDCQLGAKKQSHPGVVCL